MIGNLISVAQISEKPGKFLLKKMEKSISGNKVYINFNIAENSRETFSIIISNPLATAISFSLDLLNGGYKLINLNEYNIDFIRGG